MISTETYLQLTFQKLILVTLFTIVIIYDHRWRYLTDGSRSGGSPVQSFAVYVRIAQSEKVIAKVLIILTVELLCLIK